MPVVALAQRGAFRPVSVVAAVQAFFPLPPPPATATANGTATPPPRPAATLTAWAVRAGPAGPEFAACASVALPYPATPADAQVGPPARLDLGRCGPAAAALVFGLTDRTAFFDAPNAAFLSDSYFTLDDLTVCVGGGGSGSGSGGSPALSSVAPPPASLYLQSPPLAHANRRRRRRRRLAQQEEVPAPPPPSPPQTTPPLPGSIGAVPPPPRPQYVAGGGSGPGGPPSRGVAAVAAAAATSGGGSNSLTTAPRAGGEGAAPAAARAAAAAATAAVGGPSKAAAAPASACFANGFDHLTWRPTVNNTLETDAYVSYYRPLEDGTGLAWVNLAVVRDATPPPAASSAPLFARPRFGGPVYAFATRGAFRPVSVAVAPLCAPSMPGAPVDPALCPGPPAPPPVFEVAALRAGGPDGVSGAALAVCASAALGLPPPPPSDANLPGARGIGVSGDPVTLDLSACGPAVLGLRFRLVPPFPGRELGWGLDDLILCPASAVAGGRGGMSSVAALEEGAKVELPTVDPPAYPL